jgi:hypothetical protein
MDGVVLLVYSYSLAGAVDDESICSIKIFVAFVSRETNSTKYILKYINIYNI